MPLQSRRKILANEILTAILFTCATILAFADYCQTHSWFDACTSPLGESLRWGIAMGLPTALAGLLVWRQAAMVSDWVRRGPAAALLLWVVLAAGGAAFGAIAHVLTVGPGATGAIWSLFSRMFDLLPEVSALAAFGICLALLRSARWRGKNEADSKAGEWIAFPGTPALYLRCNDIRYLNSAGNYCEIHTDARTHLVRMTLSQANDRLESAGFVRIHRTLIVNLARVHHIDRSPRMRTPAVRIDNGDRLPLGKAYIAAVIQKLQPAVASVRS